MYLVITISENDTFIVLNFGHKMHQTIAQAFSPSLSLAFVIESVVEVHEVEVGVAGVVVGGDDVALD